MHAASDEAAYLVRRLRRRSSMRFLKTHYDRRPARLPDAGRGGAMLLDSLLKSLPAEESAAIAGSSTAKAGRPR